LFRTAHFDFTRHAAAVDPGQPTGINGSKHARQRSGYRTVVDSLDFRVVARLPFGVTVVPAEEDLVLSTSTPLLSTVCLLEVVLLPPSIGAGAAVVDWVDVVLEDDVCASATPVIKASAVVAASQVLIMCQAPKD
jgi:hypothetical protein